MMNHIIRFNEWIIQIFWVYKPGGEEVTGYFPGVGVCPKGLNGLKGARMFRNGVEAMGGRGAFVYSPIVVSEGKWGELLWDSGGEARNPPFKLGLNRSMRS